MGQSKDIMQDFLEAHPEVGLGHLTIEEINKKMASFMSTRNRRPLSDFDGLSPEQMHWLLNLPDSASSMMQRASNIADEVIDQIPFFRLAEILMKILGEEDIKLTTKGNLPLPVCRRLYNSGFLEQEDIKMGVTKKISEDNVRFIMALKACLLVSPFVKKQNNTLSLTRAGISALSEGRSSLFWRIFDCYTQRFNWGYLDYAQQIEAGQFGWAFSLYLMEKYGHEWREAGFYAEKSLQAFPHLRNQVDGPLEPERVYRWRFIEHFALWFGLVEIKWNKQDVIFDRPLLIRKTPNLDRMLWFDI